MLCNTPSLLVPIVNDLVDIPSYRTMLYRFSNLQIQDDENGVTADLPSATSSNGTVSQPDSDDVRTVSQHFSFIYPS